MIPTIAHQVRCWWIVVACIAAMPATGAADDFWNDDWQQTIADAEADGQKPVLVKYEASWCGPCQVLSESMREPAIQGVLKKFYLVRIDVDAPPEGADVSDVNAMPTMRILSPDGVRIDEHVGLMQGDPLRDWLGAGLSQFQDSQIRQRMLAGMDPQRLDDQGVLFLIELLGDRSPQRRAAAAEVLIQQPQRVAKLIVDTALDATSLRQRTAAWTILHRWPAPTDGLDPWMPETFTPERIAALQAWADGIANDTENAVSPENDPMGEPTRLESELELDRLVRRGPIRDGLVDAITLVGPTILPSVTERLSRESSDVGRERLSAVRYRLIAAPTLALRLPGAAEDLASLESGPRRAATKRIADQAIRDDLPLLETLFGHDDPLVRELALRGMQSAGGGTAESLLRLLDDPDKNVRVAVLKLWMENPNANLIPPISRRALQEQDPGLLSYYIRLIKAIDVVRPESNQVLEKLAQHEDWQVRADVAGVIAEHVQKSGSPWKTPKMPSAYQAIARTLLQDSDSYVLSQIVPPVLTRDQEGNFDRLVEIAWQHPEIRETILTGLPTEAPDPKTITLLTSRLASDVADDRVFALQALTHFGDADLESAVQNGLRDPSSSVRVAAVRSLSVWLDKYRAALPVVPQIPNDRSSGGVVYSRSFSISSGSAASDSSASSGTGWLGAVAQLFGGDGGGEAAVEIIDDEDWVQLDDAELNVDAAMDFDDEMEIGDDMLLDDADLFMADGQVIDPSDQATLADILTESSDAPGPTIASAGPPETGRDAATDKQVKAAQRYDDWLVTWRQSPASEVAWLATVPEIVADLMALDDPESRAHATLAAARLGMDVPLESIRDSFRHVDQPDERIASLYPWMQPDVRAELFAWVDEAADGDELLSTLYRLASQYDPADAVTLFWDGLRRFRIESFETGWSVRQTLMKLTTGQEYFYGEDHPGLEPAAAALAERLKTIPEPVARLVGLSVLGEIDADRARALIDDDHQDTTIDKRLRRDWARFMLSLQPQPEFARQAIAYLDDEALRSVGLSAIAKGYDGVSSTEIGHLSVPSEDDDMTFSGRLDVASIPAGIDPDVMRPLLRSDTADTVAMVTYVLVILGDDISLDALLEAAKQEGFQFGGPMTELLVKAIAFRDDESMIHHLETIYQSIDADSSYDARDLYWKIRIMTGPGALALRQRMRADFGMQTFI